MQYYTCPNTNYQITIDLDRDNLLNNLGKELLQDGYLKEGETSPQHAFARVSCAFADNQEHAQRLYNYASNLWFMYATPVLANGGTKAGLPISCFVSHIEDTVDDLIAKASENAYIAVAGGGTGANWSSIRSLGTRISRTGGKTPGLIPFLKVMDSIQSAYQQSGTRRGSTAAYLDVSHPEIEEFLEVRDAIGADPQRRCLSIGFHHAVNIPDAFMQAVIDGDDWNLIDPHTKEVKDTVYARDLWKKILTARIETGEPYLHFIDTSNEALPQVLKDKGLKIRSSQLCAEIFLPTEADRTAVCCLSSVNLDTYDEWGTDSEIHDLFVEDLFRMLDNVLGTFIKDAPPSLWRAVNSATKERSVGLGAMGFHSYLQSIMVPFESVKARTINQLIFSKLKVAAHKANKILGAEKGSPEDLQGTGDRFAHMFAIAPNANSSIICGNISPSIEPLNSNAYTQDTKVGVYSHKNKYLVDLLAMKYYDTPEVWTDIFVNGGSVQHLTFLSEDEKKVFKTAFEIEQEWIITHASDRQPYICQGQSVNLFLRPDIKYSVLHNLHKMAWELGLKSLYYCRSKKISEVKRQETTPKPVVKCEEDVCLMCQG